MIRPGVKRPPPIGSELVRKPAPEGVRGVCCEGDREGVFLGVVTVAGAIVSAFDGSLPKSVASVFASTACPHAEQNLPVGETCTPHEEQNIRGEILPSRGYLANKGKVASAICIAIYSGQGRKGGLRSA